MSERGFCVCVCYLRIFDGAARVRHRAEGLLNQMRWWVRGLRRLRCLFGLGRLGRLSLSTPSWGPGHRYNIAFRLHGLKLRALGLPRGLRRLRLGIALIALVRGCELSISEGRLLLPAFPPPLVQFRFRPHPTQLVVPPAMKAQLIAEPRDGGRGDGEAVGEQLLVELLVCLWTVVPVCPVRPDLVLERVGYVGADVVEAGVPLLETVEDSSGLHLAAVLGEKDLLDPCPGRLVLVELDDEVFVSVTVSTGASSGHDERPREMGREI